MQAGRFLFFIAKVRNAGQVIAVSSCSVLSLRFVNREGILPTPIKKGMMKALFSRHMPFQFLRRNLE